jgi:hypothetical protein
MVFCRNRTEDIFSKLKVRKYAAQKGCKKWVKKVKETSLII